MSRTPLISSLCLVRSPLNKAVKRGFLAAVRSAFDSDLETKELPDQELGPTDVLVKVRSAGINHADLRMIRDEHQVKLKEPFVPGFEFAGEVIRAGPAAESLYSVGDRVLGLKHLTTGAFAQQCVAQPGELYKIPHSVSYEVAASIPVAYGTALLALEYYAKVKEGERVVVISNQGSTGMAAIDLAVNNYKCCVIGVSNDHVKCDLMRKKGVMSTVDSSVGPGELKTALKTLEMKNFDVLFDTVGGPLFKEALNFLKPAGRVCMVGASSGLVPNIDSSEIAKAQACFSAPWLGGYAFYDYKAFHSLIEWVIDMIDKQYIEPMIGQKFDFKDINHALKAVADQAVMGKTILNFTDS